MRRTRKWQAYAVPILLGALLGLLAACPSARAQDQLIAAVEVEKNEYISRDAILDAVKEILRVGDPYTQEKGDQARQAVLRMGYFAEVTVAHEVVEQGVKVIITVVEKQRIEKIVFVGNTVLNDRALLEVMRSNVGHIIDDELIRRDVLRIQDEYGKHGYLAQVAQARVDRFGVLTIVIDEARIEGFKIEGLKRTKEWVVRRLIETKPGVLYRFDDVSRDIGRIYNTQIFQSVTAEPRPGVIDPTAVTVVIQVEEKRTGVASVAAAYSDLDKFVFMISVAETNFRGRAETASVNLEAFGRTSYDVRFYEPFLDKKNTSMDVSVFDTERRRRFVGGGIPLAEDRFRERRIGGTVRLSRPTALTQRFTVGLRSEEVTSSFFNASRDLGPISRTVQPLSLRAAQVRGGTSWVPGDPNQAAGPGDFPGDLVVAAPLHPGGRVNSTSLQYTWDTRDIQKDPTRGSYRDLSVEIAGKFLGGRNDYNLYSFEQRKYLPVRNGKDVLAMRLMVGLSSGNVPLFDSFSVGGATTVRGFEQDRYRGESMVLGNLEYRYRMSESLKLVAFVDVGDAYGGVFPTIVPGFTVPAEDQSLRLHVGTGLGLRADTPLGPIRIDWGTSNEGSEVHFGFGQVF